MKGMITAAVFISMIITAYCRYPEKYKPLSFEGDEITGIEIIITSYIIPAGTASQSEVLVIMSSGEKYPGDGDTALWSSSDPGIAIVSGGGTITGVAPGNAVISARIGVFYASHAISVVRDDQCARLAIAEVFYDAVGSDEGKEFIEIQNGNPDPCDASGMGLVDGSASSRPYIFPAPSYIPGNGYIIIGRSVEVFQEIFGTPDLCCFTFTLNNSGETIMLLDSSGLVLDMVYIEGGTDDYPAEEPWGSLSLPSCGEGDSAQRAETDTDTWHDWFCAPPAPWH